MKSAEFLHTRTVAYTSHFYAKKITMHIRRLGLISLLLYFSLISFGALAQKQAEDKAPKGKIAIWGGKDVLNYLGNLDSALPLCAAKFALYQEKLKLIESEHSLKRLQERGLDPPINREELQKYYLALLSEQSKAPRDHEICAEQAKQELLPQGKLFVGAMRSAASKLKSKDFLASWMTALDALGESNFSAEVSKFQLISNGLKIEMRI